MSDQITKIDSFNPELDKILTEDDLLALEEDPSKMETVARLMGAVNLDNLFRLMQNPETGLNAKIEFQKLLNKMGRLEPDTKTQEQTTAQVVINITRAKDDNDGMIIDAT